MRCEQEGMNIEVCMCECVYGCGCVKSGQLFSNDVDSFTDYPSYRTLL